MSTSTRYVRYEEMQYQRLMARVTGFLLGFAVGAIVAAAAAGVFFERYLAG